MTPASRSIRALVFDFDGLILETEVPVLESWRRVYADHGVQLPMETWMQTIGTADHDFDPFGHLVHLVGRPLDREPIQLARIRHRDAVLHAQDVLPGVRAYIEEAAGLGLRMAVASSSSRAWVMGHLARLGIIEHWDAVLTADDVARTKPDPELYLAAAAALDVEPREAVAFEDSENGVRAAKAAGLWCVAIPGVLTANMDFSLADARLEALSVMPLVDLLASLGSD